MRLKNEANSFQRPILGDISSLSPILPLERKHSIMDTRIKLVSFDLDGVLLIQRHQDPIQNLINKYNFEEEFLRNVLFERSCSVGGYNRLKLGQIQSTEYWNWLLSELNLIGRATSIDIISTLCSGRSIDPNVVNIIEKLRTQQIMTATCSNNYKDNIDYYMAKFNIDSYFDRMVFSFEVGAMKPHASIFLELLNRCNLSPWKVLYFDDNSENVQAAAELGIHSYKYENYAKLAECIKMHDIEL